MSAQVEPCQHASFSVNAHCTREIDGSKKSSYRLDVRVSCSDCGAPMKFKGLPAGYNRHGAACSEDQFEARLAYQPPHQG